jgi:hypothetical protein
LLDRVFAVPAYATRHHTQEQDNGIHVGQLKVYDSQSPHFRHAQGF